MADDIRIILKTNRGDIHATIFASEVPVTASNFLNLASRGYYDGITFHRVIPDFMIQGGDPTGTGMGGPGYKFADECKPNLRHSKPGIFSMANAGPNTNGSQFFVTHVPTDWLDGKHTVFGETTDGQDVVHAVRQGDQITGIEILDSTDTLFEENKNYIDQWNAVLNK
ncbi:peptidylprolyl isomerase [Sulfuriroseicoccus oceanibius]|uniref:Peptidyl-prolyl cis-trans isomerase n=1 Tax=Sulfuriroseicoccus oceanibius TaxID=2707525 RepID=A0A6B3LG10_9BACT|nr:peptidylprolyl isomerase [Sulfuriroseicoccus oceanibius]QQL45353.1 peptidylprolyl isomerase [Sulfuriroseicoccus oceanibius]